jgi:hypothetical protein
VKRAIDVRANELFAEANDMLFSTLMTPHPDLLDSGRSGIIHYIVRRVINNRFL